jgi:hypothetical protein
VRDEQAHRDLKYRLFVSGPLAKLGVNAGGNGSCRWPGSQNHKPKRRYSDGESPRVQLVRAALGLFVTVAELEHAGLLGDAPPVADPRVVREIRGRLPKGWPDINECYASHGKDRSTAEFVWCMKALRRGWPAVSVEAELARIGDKAVRRARDSYVSMTVSRAASIVLGAVPPTRGEDVLEVTL